MTNNYYNKQPRFEVINHRNGTQTLIDNQTGLLFYRANEAETLKVIKLLLEGKPTNTKRFITTTLYVNRKDNKQ